MDTRSTATLGTSVLGYEWDEDADNGARRGPGPVSSSTWRRPPAPARLRQHLGAGTATHSLTLYKAPSGALVFGAGTTQWSWGLDAHHDNNAGAPVGPPTPASSRRR